MIVNDSVEIPDDEELITSSSLSDLKQEESGFSQFRTVKILLLKRFFCKTVKILLINWFLSERLKFFC
jgi:hypothetical protein